ncbi:MAG: bifunctional UDP-3-O-[3-hydroxymyristoyl] N-acetylglucosamine deacetylase/3-hydroxyacyl-ACP dehydratase [Flavobacteriia bacterium]|nr:bifunctional UDP-3-O-[3-hydroxymyristoyl] N-acetylglucosamine deacetylase/3-hydroxyacyl-ACP dehydratase [Flavobacteriia bacterium]
MSRQRTISRSVELKGVGLHTGAEVCLRFCPAEGSKGFVFRRVDLEGSPEVEAIAANVTGTERGTSIAKGSAEVHTVEHVLAALVGAEIDNCVVELDAAEPPIMDGSAHYFCEALKEAGVEEQEATREYLVINEVTHYSDPEKDVEMIAMPYDGFSVSVMVDYGTDVLGSQNATMSSIDQFNEHFSRSRTFSFLHELEYLLDNGMIKGGDLSNAIVYVDKDPGADTMQKLQKAFNKEQVNVRPNGILDNLELHYPNEAARHKLLDVIGDLALVGRPIKGRIFARRPGHKGNSQFARMLFDKLKKEVKKGAPAYDPNARPQMDINAVMDMLPHRPPFLLVDKVLEMSETHVVGMKNVTMNEQFFVGHFPGAPVMPGVLQVEAMAQVGGILALSLVPDPENYLTYFLKIDGVRFKQKVLPGDTLIFVLRMIEPMRRGIISMKGQAFVGKKLVAEAELMAQIAKVK